MITNNLFYELIDLKRVLKGIELFKVNVDLNSKSIIQHKLVRIETNLLDLQGRIMISKYIANQLLALTPQVIYPGLVSELNLRLTNSFITAGQPRIIPAVVGDYHFKEDFITDYFDGISDILVSVIPSVSPSATQNKLLVGVTATLYVKKIGTDPLESDSVESDSVESDSVESDSVESDSVESDSVESDSVESVDIGFINRKEVDVNLISMDTSSNTIDYYDICFNGLFEHDQILRKKIIDELTKFI